MRIASLLPSLTETACALGLRAALVAGTIAVVLQFQTSSGLAAAYGIAVTGTMAITSILFYMVCIYRWHYSQARALALLVPFLAIDLAFFAANALKFLDGGWFPLAIGVGDRRGNARVGGVSVGGAPRASGGLVDYSEDAAPVTGRDEDVPASLRAFVRRYLESVRQRRGGSGSGSE